MNRTAQANRDLSGGEKPGFLITIDTEGDNLWSKPRTITTENAKYLARFQSLCEAHGLKATYLTNYEMAKSDVFREFGRETLRRGTAEVGMHLHAWNTPPLVPLTDDDFRFQPYLFEYPEKVMLEKIATITGELEEAFDCKMVTHRAGRWGLNESYAKMLVDYGYRIDCSVTPHISWKEHPGDPQRDGGPDYTRYPDEPYFVNLENIDQPGDSPLLELPMTVLRVKGPVPKFVHRAWNTSPFGRRILNRLSPTYWLRPDGKNRTELLYIVNRAEREKRSYIQFMLHSSEFMPGGSPTFPTERDIEMLYADLDALFGVVRGRFVGRTLGEHYPLCVKEHHEKAK